MPPRHPLPRPAVALVAATVLLAGACLEIEPPPPPPEESAPAPAEVTEVAPPEPRAVTARGDLAADEAATIELFRNASPSVVFITTVTRGVDRFTLNLLEIPRGSGSGFVWDREGHVVTNFHVVRGASGARVTLADQSDWEAELVGVAPEKDLAVLRIDAPEEFLPPIPVGRSLDLQVGQKVFAIGNPFGLDQTLTTGVISALGREIQSLARLPIRDVVQTDAAINPGNSGGPLLDSAGRLIGVNTAIYSPSGTYAGIGFAIPVDTVAWVVPELIASGELRRPVLGVDVAYPELARRLGVEEGALVLRVQAGSGADRGGLRPTRRGLGGRVVPGDVIVAIEGERVSTPDDLTLLLERHQVGERVAVTVLRDGRERRLEVELGPPV